MNPIARLLTALAVSALAACVKAPVAADEAGLRALDAAYVAAWLNQDAAEQEAAVLALFDRNAVILPGAVRRRKTASAISGISGFRRAPRRHSSRILNTTSPMSISQAASASCQVDIRSPSLTKTNRWRRPAIT